MSKKIKYAVLTFSLALIVAFSAAASACTIKTKHPRAEITIEFNNVTYEIEYTLYRNMYPQTVQHFIELADEGFYDNMIIHNYQTNDWFTGAYSYDDGSEDSLAYADAFSANALREYLEKGDKEAAYYALFNAGKLTPSVYKQLSYDENGKEAVDKADALPTLIGEFTDNDHNIEKGALSATFGCLKMFYYGKGDTNRKVAIENSFGQILEHDYKYNAATSVFAIQTGTSSSYGTSSYCIFAQLRNDSAREKLEALQDAITDYKDGLSTSFTTSVTVEVDNLDTFASDGGRNIETSFTVPSLPIVIKTVKITKY